MRLHRRIQALNLKTHLLNQFASCFTNNVMSLWVT